MITQFMIGQLTLAQLMIPQLMIGALIFTAFAAVAAYCAELACRSSGRQARYAWLLALVSSLAWIVIAPLLGSASSVSVLPTLVVNASGMEATVRTLVPSTAGLLSHAGVGRWLLLAWGLSSAVLIIRMLLAMRMIARIRRSAVQTTMDGVPVLLAESTGPAVIGSIASTIVVPAWLSEFDPALRAIVLRHELQHCEARDTRMLLIASIATALVPWNATLWWISRRLRLAIEIDCDVRTLRVTGTPHSRYMKLIMLVAQRSSQLRLAAMLASSPSNLSRRIVAMTGNTTRYSRPRIIVASFLAMAAIGAACSTRLASNITSPSSTDVGTHRAEAVSGASDNSRPYFEFEVDKAAMTRPGQAAPMYPESLRQAKVEGMVTVQFVVKEDGTADMNTFKVLKSTDSLFTVTVREGLPKMMFTPAEYHGRIVKQVVQLPFAFALPDK